MAPWTTPGGRAVIRKFIIPGAVVLASVLGAVTLLATSPELIPAAAEPVPTAVRAMEVEPAPIQLTVHSQGTVMPSIESDLIPEVSGRIVSMSPSLVAGGYFEKGDTLLRLDDEDYRTAVDRARSTLTRAEAEYAHARYEYQRHKELESKQLVSRSLMENTLRTFRVAEAARKDAKVALEQAQRDLARTRIMAPFTGLVRSEQVDIGQFVSRGESIAKIYATDTVEVRLPLADRQLAFLDVPLGMRGQFPEGSRPAVTLTADYAGRHYEWLGAIVRTEAEIDMRSRMVHVVARVENDVQETPLAVGLFVEAEITGSRAEDIVVLPRNALRDGNQVLIVDAENRLRFRDVTPLRLYRDEVLIQSGLEAGERVCISPLQTAIDGMVVTPVEPDADVAGT
jgi:RND family efflux transporter MFP subunit